MADEDHDVAQLEARWRQLATELRWADAADAVGSDLIDRYREPHRRYHSVTHVRWVLSVMDDLARPSVPSVESRLAAWFHDAVYDPGRSDNEERSRDLAASALGRLGAPEDVTSTVCALVMATKTHDAEASPDAALLLDADLSILGADEATYVSYAAGVRAEFHHVADDLYRAGRSAILTTFLDRPRIYQTDLGRDRFEDSARANVANELVRLAAGAQREP